MKETLPRPPTTMPMIASIGNCAEIVGCSVCVFALANVAIVDVVPIDGNCSIGDDDVIIELVTVVGIVVVEFVGGFVVVNVVDVTGVFVVAINKVEDVFD